MIKAKKNLGEIFQSFVYRILKYGNTLNFAWKKLDPIFVINEKLSIFLDLEDDVDYVKELLDSHIQKLTIGEEYVTEVQSDENPVPPEKHMIIIASLTEGVSSIKND